MTSGVTHDPLGKCPWCGGIHSATCPRVKALEYGPNGQVTRVEFHPPPPPPVSAIGQYVVGEGH